MKARLMRALVVLMGAGCLCSPYAAVDARRRHTAGDRQRRGRRFPPRKAPFFDITAFGAVSGGPARRQPDRDQQRDRRGSGSRRRHGRRPGRRLQDLQHPPEEQRRPASRCDQTSILRAAVQGTGANQDGGFYDAPEVNLFVGLQDQGHSHWANSLIYGIGVAQRDDLRARADRRRLSQRQRRRHQRAVRATIPARSRREPSSGTAARRQQGDRAQELRRNIIFRDFSIKNGGHFAIIGTGVIGWTVDDIIVDTNRDAIDIDASQNVTVRNSVFNSLTDDAIVLKASFGLGVFLPTQNVLIENCTVSGYDAGSVIDGVYSVQKLVATDLDGPTARVKFGTEGTTGFNTVTIRNVTLRPVARLRARVGRRRGAARRRVDRRA